MAAPQQCPHGHPWTPATTYVRPDGIRSCRRCRSRRQRTYERRVWEAIVLTPV